jgi:hypothetical protein
VAVVVLGHDLTECMLLLRIVMTVVMVQVRRVLS